MSDRHKQVDQKTYDSMVKRLSPNSPMASGLLRAFWVGGLLCAIGQGLGDFAHSVLQMTTRDSISFTAIVVVFVTALLTGIGIYDRIGQYAGAGAFVPISGFANAMVAPALEYRGEGLILGLGAKLFTIAGPVLVYGVGASVVVGLIYAIFGL